MTTKKIRYKATIAGKSYTIIGSRSEEHVRLVIETLNEQMDQIELLSKDLDAEKKAILTAVNAVSDQLAMQVKMQELQDKISVLELQLKEVQEQMQR